MVDRRGESALLSAADFTATREGRWYVVRFRGRYWAGRHTRDESFTAVLVMFNASQSPSHPQTEGYLETRWNGARRLGRVQWLGPWRPGERARWARRNCIEIPITRTDERSAT